MKNVSKIISAACLAAAVSLALLMHSCEKEKSLTVGSPAGGGSMAGSEQRIPQDSMEYEMNWFINQSKQSTPSFNKLYEAYDALLIFEAALNYHTGKPDSSYDMIFVDSTSLNLQVLFDQDQTKFRLANNLSILADWLVFKNRAQTAKQNVPPSIANLGVGAPFNIVVDLEFLLPDSIWEPTVSALGSAVPVVMKTWVGNKSLGSLGPCNWDPNETWYATYGDAPNRNCGSNTQTIPLFQAMLQRITAPCRMDPTTQWFVAYISSWGISGPPSGGGYSIFYYPNNPPPGCPTSFLFYTDNYPGYANWKCLTAQEEECFTQGAINGSIKNAPYGPSPYGKKVALAWDFHDLVPLCSGCQYKWWATITGGNYIRAW